MVSSDHSKRIGGFYDRSSDEVPSLVIVLVNLVSSLQRECCFQVAHIAEPSHVAQSAASSETNDYVLYIWFKKVNQIGYLINTSILRPKINQTSEVPANTAVAIRLPSPESHRC
jgi:hypothetical protein